MKIDQHDRPHINLNRSYPASGNHPGISSRFPVFAPELAIQNEGFDKTLFETLYAIEPTHFWFKSRNKLLTQCLKKYFPAARNYCEIGCGTGNVLQAISAENPHMDITGSEIYLSALDYAAARVPHANLIQADVCQFPFESEFDVIGSFDVLEHIDNDTLALQNIYKALTHNGGLILTVPQHKWLWSNYDEMACHKRRYSMEDLHEKVKAAGFKITRMTSFMTFLLPVMMASRFKKTSDPSTLLKINRAMNSVFYKISQAEQALIKKNINLPFGGSLLCIARK
jgi:2-polyprenyl-3-methyl-5-hydroxy-6-metoxy-1,4-benzoquinol methylase